MRVGRRRGIAASDSGTSNTTPMFELAGGTTSRRYCCVMPLPSSSANETLPLSSAVPSAANVASVCPVAAPPSVAVTVTRAPRTPLIEPEPSTPRIGNAYDFTLPRFAGCTSVRIDDTVDEICCWCNVGAAGAVGAGRATSSTVPTRFSARTIWNLPSEPV